MMDCGKGNESSVTLLSLQMAVLIENSEDQDGVIFFEARETLRLKPDAVKEALSCLCTTSASARMFAVQKIPETGPLTGQIRMQAQATASSVSVAGSPASS